MLTCNFLYFQSLSPAEKQRLRDEFMHEFDENRDGRIEMAEVITTFCGNRLWSDKVLQRN